MIRPVPDCPSILRIELDPSWLSQFWQFWSVFYNTLGVDGVAIPPQLSACKWSLGDLISHGRGADIVCPLTDLVDEKELLLQPFERIVSGFVGTSTSPDQRYKTSSPESALGGRQCLVQGTIQRHNTSS